MKTELVRYVRICSDILSYEEIKSCFYSRLRDRGFPIDFLDAEFSKVRYSDRYTFLFNNKSSNTSAVCPIFYKVEYRKNVDFVGLPDFFKNCEGDLFCQIFTDNVLHMAPMICFKKSKSLFQLLVKAKVN